MKGHAGEVAEEDKSKCQVGGLIVVSPKVVEIKMVLFITCRAGVIASIPQGQPQEGHLQETWTELRQRGVPTPLPPWEEGGGCGVENPTRPGKIPFSGPCGVSPGDS